MKRIVAVNSNCYHGFTLEEAVSGIQAAGFHYIELTATKGWTEHIFPDMSFARLDAVRDLLEEKDLVPFALSGHCNLMDPQRRPDFIRNIRLAEFFGCDYIVSSVGEAHLKDARVADDETVARALLDLLPELERRGLVLALETHGDHGTGARLAPIVRRVNSGLVRLNFDTANVIFYGGADPCGDLEACVPEVGYMHLKDKAGADREWNFPAPGKGRIDFPRLFRILEENRNACPLSVEIEFTQAGAKDVSEVDRAVLDSAAFLKAQGFEL